MARKKVALVVTPMASGYDKPVKATKTSAVKPVVAPKKVKRRVVY